MRSRERTPRLYRVLHAVVPPIVGALYRPWTEGMENIPERGPAILASNHQSFLDSVFVPAACKRPIYYLGKSDYFEGWQRWFFESVGVMPVHRQGGGAAEASLRRGQQILEAGHLLGIYPEGTRSPDGRLYRGKTGPARLAMRTGAPIVPVGLVGTFEVLPPHASIPRIRRVGIRVGKPLDAAARYAGRENDRFALRAVTDELMYELMMLSGQQYVDEYAARVKSGEVEVSSARLDELGQLIEDTDDLLVRKAS